MTTTRDIVIHAGEAFSLSLPYAGTAGRGQRTHIRTADSTATVVQILTHNGDANARVIYNDSTQMLDYTIGASVSAAWVVNANRVEWVFDTEDYDLSDVDDVVIPFRGKTIVYGNRTRESDVTPSDQMPSGDGRYVRFDGVQGLSAEQQLQARENIGVTGGGGGGSGDVVGPASATDDRIAAFDGVTGKLIKQGSVTATAVASHLSSTSNPHSVTAAQVGADPAGTASTAVSTHAGATDPHGDRAYADSLAVNYATAAQGALADSAVQDVAAEIHAATAASLADDDEQGFWQSASSAMRKITWANVKATLKAYFDTLYAAITHAHAASAITSGTIDAARLPSATTGAAGAVEIATVAEVETGTDTSRAVTPQGYRTATPPYVEWGASGDKTLALTDAAVDQWCNNGATARVLNIPANSSVAFATGTKIPILRLGSGTCTIDAATGVTLNGVSGGSCTISTQYQGALLTKTGTDSWVISGDVSAVA